MLQQFLFLKYHAEKIFGLPFFYLPLKSLHNAKSFTTEKIYVKDKTFINSQINIFITGRRVEDTSTQQDEFHLQRFQSTGYKLLIFDGTGAWHQAPDKGSMGN